MKQSITKTTRVALFVFTLFVGSAFVNAQTPVTVEPKDGIAAAQAQTSPVVPQNTAATKALQAAPVAAQNEATTEKVDAPTALKAVATTSKPKETVAAATPKDALAAASANLIEATKEYKASSTELLAMQEQELAKAVAKLEDLKALVTDGLVAKATLESEEQSVAALRTRFEATQKQIADSENRISQIKAEQELAKNRAASPVKLVAKAYVPFNTSSTILRSSGGGSWSLGGLGDVQSFFFSSFGHSLPTSAVGQSATHNRLNYDHRNAVDVALHPDSAEGRALIGFLQSRGIPFLAFRGAVPGVATGPHIHIGSPSHRLS